MIHYQSTRGNKKAYSFLDVLLKGIADDGGLFIPEKLPKITSKQLKLLSGKSYQERANFVFNLFEPDLSKSLIRKIVNSAYSTHFDSPQIVPLVSLKQNQYILELWHGPTASFKDMALQIMPLFFSEAVKRENKNKTKRGKKSIHYFILVATSGDTGKAALEGYRNNKNISIIVFYPKGHVSQLQELQMVTQEGSNLAVYAVRGDFDDVQTLIKDIYSDEEFNKRLIDLYQVALSSANSINWGRIIPQIIYYINSYIELTDRHIIEVGESIDVAVPTGNFGNILAEFYAKKMGLPIGKLICASNANNVLTEFLQTGIYDVKKRSLVQTPSPSMDILIASNIERLLYAMTRSSEKVSVWMHKLKEKKKFIVDNKTKIMLRKEFYADWVSNNDCLLNIKKLYDETNYLLDPHTSVAQVVAERYLRQNSVSSPLLICSTAHWAKFAENIYKTFHNVNKDEKLDEFEILKKIHKLVKNTSIPKAISNLKKKKIRYKNTYNVSIQLVESQILNWLRAKRQSIDFYE